MQKITTSIDGYFSSEDPRFLPVVLRCEDDGWLGELAERWYTDTRPFARQALLRYIDDGCDRCGHRPLVKRLFKQAEAAGDDEAMLFFLVAFDRFPRQTVSISDWYNYQAGDFEQYTRLTRDLDVPSSAREAEKAGRFTRKTRQYLRRRAVRYFRYIGMGDKTRYRRAALHILRRVDACTLEEELKLYDAWSLMTIMYHGALHYHFRGYLAPVQKQASVFETMDPAPLFPDVWKECDEEILSTLQRAPNTVVQKWLIALLKQNASDFLKALPPERVNALVCSPFAQIQTFGVKLLRQRSDLKGWTLDQWLVLIKSIHQHNALTEICTIVHQQLDPATLSLAELVDLASVQAAPIADVAFDWLKERLDAYEGGLSASDLQTFIELSKAKIARIRIKSMQIIAHDLQRSPHVTMKHMRYLLDAPEQDVRSAALEVMFSEQRWRSETALWLALSESPYGHVRDRLIAHLGEQEETLEPKALQRVWATTLFSPNRGSRAKRNALRQISARIRSHNDETWMLIPLLAAALRSVRSNERLEALTSIVKAVHNNPKLRARVGEHIHELKIGTSEEITA